MRPEPTKTTNPTRQMLLTRAAGIVEMLEQAVQAEKHTILLKDLSNLGQEYLDLENAMRAMPTIGNPLQTLWDEHCWSHNLGQDHGFFTLLNGGGK